MTTDDTAAHGIPAWVDDYWPPRARVRAAPPDLPFSVAERAMEAEREEKARRLVDNACLVVSVRHIPDERTVLAGVRARPDAEPLLRRWQDLWERSMSPYGLFPVQTSQEAKEVWLDSVRRLATRRYEAGDRDTSARERAKLERYAAREGRDRGLHVIDDAASFLSLLEARPNAAILRIIPPSRDLQLIPERTFVLTGHMEDGCPVLVPDPSRGYSTVGRKETLAKHTDGSYLSGAAYRTLSRRLHAETRTMEHTVAVLGAMARAGHRKAFVKGIDPKSGTWTVDLAGAASLADIAGRFASATFPGTSRSGFLIQEHLAFTHEQRFFVTGGKVVAGVCSDRDLCAVDTRPGKRLDDRVAVIHKPAGETGEYDRGRTGWKVDRAMAAAFARVARRFAAMAAGEGHVEYVVDVGMTERGPAVIEVNGFLSSGPYCLDRGIIARAAARSRDRLDRHLAARCADVVAELGMTAEEVAGMIRDCRPDDLRQLEERPDYFVRGYCAEKWPPAFTRESFSEGALAVTQEDLDRLRGEGVDGDCLPLFRIPQVVGGLRSHPCHGHLLAVLSRDGILRVRHGALADRNGVEVLPPRPLSVPEAKSHSWGEWEIRLGAIDAFVRVDDPDGRAHLRIADMDGNTVAKASAPLPEHSEILREARENHRWVVTVPATRLSAMVLHDTAPGEGPVAV